MNQLQAINKDHQEYKASIDGNNILSEENANLDNGNRGK